MAQCCVSDGQTTMAASTSTVIAQAAPMAMTADFLHLCYVRGSIGCQMLILRVSGIRKMASTKHTAGTAIG